MFVKSVTSQTDEDIRLMLEQLLTEFLDSLVYESKEVSVTRRSAGLSILIHKLLANDLQPGKVSYLYVICNTCIGTVVKIFD